MANLTQIAESLNVPININENKQKHAQTEINKPEGKKRRDWISDYPITPQGYLKENRSFVFEKKEPNNTLSLKDLRSNPLKVAQYIFESSKNEPNNITEKITRSEIMAFLKLSKDSVKTATRFLLRNFLIERIDFRPGKTGWSKFKITTNLFNELKIAYENKSLAIQKTENMNTTTIKQETEWDNIDISQLEHIGLNKKHILQLKPKNTPIVVQESIFHFAYGLKFNQKVKNYDSPLSVLIGVLRKGEAWIETNYRTTQEIAQENIIKNLKEQKERLEKLQEEAFVLAFSDWYNSLSTETTEEIIHSITSSSQGTKNLTPKKVLLRTYFNQTIWPNKKQHYLT